MSIAEQRQRFNESPLLAYCNTLTTYREVLELVSNSPACPEHIRRTARRVLDANRDE